MYGQINRLLLDGQIDWCMYGDRLMYVWTDRLMERLIDVCMDRQIYVWMDRQIASMDGYID